MPTYEYECKKCGHRFDRFQPITAAPIKTCPKCRGRVARLLSGGAGIIFKGSGFYQTDYKKPAPAKSGDKPAPGAKEATPKTDSAAKPPPKKEAAK